MSMTVRLRPLSRLAVRLPSPRNVALWVVGAVLALAGQVSAQDPEGLCKDALGMIKTGVEKHQPEQVAEALSDIDMVYVNISDKMRKKVDKALGKMFSDLVPREPSATQRPGDLVDATEGTRLECETCYTLAVGILHDKEDGAGILLSALKKKHIKDWPEVRGLIYEGLGLRADASLIKEFTKVLEDSEPEVAFQAAAALGRFHDADMKVRRQAASALVKAFSEHAEAARKEAKKGKGEERAEYLVAVEVAFNESLVSLTRASRSNAEEWVDWLKEHGKDEEW